MPQLPRDDQHLHAGMLFLFSTNRPCRCGGVHEEAFARVNQACSDASYLKIMACSSFTFLFLRLFSFLSLLGAIGFWFLELAVPF